MHPTDTVTESSTQRIKDASTFAIGERLPDLQVAPPPPEPWQALLDWLYAGVSPEADWPGLAERLAGLLGADFCCVVMRHRQEGQRLSVSAHGRGGALSMAARRELVRSGSRIRSLLGGDAAGADAVDGMRPQALYQVVRIEGEAIGVLHARRDGVAAPGFTPAQRAQAAAVAALVGQALQLERLQGLMRSEYARLALLGTGDGASGAAAGPITAVADPAGMSRRLAAALYRELRTLRLDDRHVVAAAAELVALLSADLRSRLSDASKFR